MKIIACFGCFMIVGNMCIKGNSETAFGKGSNYDITLGIA